MQTKENVKEKKRVCMKGRERIRKKKINENMNLRVMKNTNSKKLYSKKEKKERENNRKERQ